MQQNRDGELKYYKQFGLFSLILLLSLSSLSAGSFEDFKRLEDRSFSQYKDERDAEFNNYLKQQWDEYSASASKPMYKREKPKSIAPAIEKKAKSVGPRVNIKISSKILKDTNLTKPVKKEMVSTKKDLNIIFFGQALGFSIDSKIKDAKFYPKNQSGVSNFFSVLASSNYAETIIEIKSTKKELNLNDWALYMLVNQISNELYLSSDDRKLFSWFIFNKLGYSVKVGLQKKHIVLMHYSKKIIYATPSYKFGAKSFYVLSHYAKGKMGRVYTYKQNYPDADSALDLELKSLPKFQEDKKYKTLRFEQFGKEYSSSFSYDKNLIDFMATYPQADYETYFNAPMSKETYEELARGIKKYIDGKTSSVAINFVLNFVQKAFIYERDEKQFSREKVMFANETLYYDKSDCEDRAILFAYLVKELFGITVIGVKYSDHMTTALYIPMKGDSVRKGRREFIIADPTYINANIGQSMPKYRSKNPESFIVVKR